MKQKTILVSFIALFAIVLTLSTVSAVSPEVDVTILDVEVDGTSIDGGKAVAGFTSNVIPIEIEFTAEEDLTDIRVKVYIEKYDISDTYRFRTGLDAGTTTKKARISLELPSSIDLKDLTSKDLGLLVRIYAEGYDIDGNKEDRTSFEESYIIRLRKDTYDLDLLSIEAPDTVTAGSVIAIDVVLHNTGSDRLDDTYVKVSIPGIVSRNVYFGDIASDIDVDYDQIRDSVNKRIYLSIPSDAVSGIYNLEVEAYNYDSNVMAKKQIVLNGVEADDTEDDDNVEVIDGTDGTDASNTVLILTVILAIIFVVLLIILIVLLTKKPSEIEEFGEGETNYY